MNTTTDIVVVYKDLLDFPGYRVSSDGRVWSCWQRDIVVRNKRILTSNWVEIGEKQLKSQNYLGVSLHRNGVQKRQNIHVLVCQAFHGPCPGPRKEYHAGHKNGNPLDNDAGNLSWRTVRENNWIDQCRHGTHVKMRPNDECPF